MSLSRPRFRHITVAAATLPISADQRKMTGSSTPISASRAFPFHVHSLSFIHVLALILALCVMTSPTHAASPNCPTSVPNCTYYWNYTWDACNYPCAPYNVDPPVKMVHATCIQTSTGLPVTDTSFCVAAVGNVTQHNIPCNTQPCVRNFANVTDRSWRACSDVCPGSSGTVPTQSRSRAPDCVSTNATGVPKIIVKDAYCPQVDPETQPCNTQPCFWVYQNTTCSTATTCGQGNMGIIANCTYKGNPSTTNFPPESYCTSAKNPPVYTCQVRPCSAYSWSCPPFPSCVPNCTDVTFTRTCQCNETTGSTFTLVSEQTCLDNNVPRTEPLTRICTGESQYCPTTPSITNPPTLSPCQRANCSSHGTCEPITATCSCDNGYWGLQCDQLPAIKFVSVSTETSTGTPDSVIVGTTLQITVSTTPNMNRISMWLTPSIGVPIYMNLSLTNKVGYFYTIPNNIPSGRFSVTVSFTAAITLSSATFTIQDACTQVKCKNGGTCSQGVCTCPFPWSGAVCDTVPACPACGSHGSCDTSTGRCACKDGYSGNTCQVPPSCTLSCQNGGRLDFSSSCRCTCPNRWTGTLCDQCGIPAVGECQSGGTPDALCQQCTCPVYNGYTWTGPTCSLAQRLVSIKLSGTTNPALGPLLAQDIQAILGWASDRVRYYDINQGSYRLVLISDTSSAIDRAVTELNTLLHFDPLVPPPNPSFALNQGYASSQIDPTSSFTSSSVPALPPVTPLPTAPPTTPPPTNPPTPPPTSSGTSFPTLYIYVAAGGGGALILLAVIIGLICWRRRRQSYGFSENVTKLGAQGVSVDIPKELQRGHGQTLANFELSPLASANPKFLASTQFNPAFAPPQNTYQIPPPPASPAHGNGESPWEPRQDEQGYQYWYNNQTGQTSWQSPY